VTAPQRGARELQLSGARLQQAARVHVGPAALAELVNDVVEHDRDCVVEHALAEHERVQICVRLRTAAPSWDGLRSVRMLCRVCAGAHAVRHRSAVYRFGNIKLREYGARV
jgi:hypothetical protein